MKHIHTEDSFSNISFFLQNFKNKVLQTENGFSYTNIISIFLQDFFKKALQSEDIVN